MLIPESDTPVKNLAITNMMYEVENALRIAKTMVDK